MTDNQHLIEYFDLLDGRRIYVYDYCKNDAEFNKKLSAYHRRYKNVTFTRANHHTVKRGNMAETKSGEWVNVRRSSARMTIGKAKTVYGKKIRRQYFFSSRELAEAFAYEMRRNDSRVTVQGRLVTVPFLVGNGTWTGSML